jgi:hypothetical protein
MLCVVDAFGKLRWHDLGPEVFVGAPSSKHTIAAGPNGDLLLLERVSYRSIRARRFDLHGREIGTFHISLSHSAFDLGTLWWPGHGWLVSVADSEVVHIHLLDLRGKRLWSRPTSVETSNSGATVVSLAIDAEESATVLWIRRNERSDPPRKNQFLTQRLSPDGKARL